MNEAVAAALDASLDTIATTAWALEPPPPDEKKHLVREAAARLVDGLLVRVAAGRGALGVVIGEGLAALAAGDRTLRLGYASVGDYARERLGIEPSTAEKMARLARELRERPLLREAVRAGIVSTRKAETILPVARGDDEAAWVARARVETVRKLQVAVHAHAREPEDDEPWERVTFLLEPEVRARLDDAMALAGKVIGAGAPKWKRLEAICTEFLSSHPDSADGDVEGLERRDRRRVQETMAETKAWLEHWTHEWEFLEKIDPVPAPGDPPDARNGVGDLDADLRRLARMRGRWDEVFGHLAMLLLYCGLWRDMQYASAGHYCAERLGIGERAVKQRAQLERRLYDFPELRQAMRDGRVSYEKARLVARWATRSTVAKWIARAEQLPCVALAREIEEKEDLQMCAAGELDARVPARVGSLLDAAFRAARAAAGRLLSYGQCVRAIAEHFIETWEPLLAERNTVQIRVLERDRGLCQVPGCSRAAAHVHHVVFRSLGGGDEPENLVSLCAAHHLHGVHMGWVRISGRAPDRIRWQLGTGGRAPPVAQA